MKPLTIFLFLLAPFWVAYGHTTHHHGNHHKQHVTLAKVVKSKPIYKKVTVPCGHHRTHHTSGNIHGAIAGGVVGGVLGHQLSSGRHQAVATIGGAAAGVIIGSHLSQGHHKHHQKRYCTDRVIVGYKNIAYWHGQKIVRVSDRPLRHIALNHKQNNHHRHHYR